MRFDSQWMAAMRVLDFERAWAVNDQLFRSASVAEGDKHSGPRHFQRIWRGESLQDARVLVRCYHGLGDTLQFIRFAAPLRRTAREVIVWCQPDLLGLVATVVGVDRVLPLHDGRVDVDFDVDVEVMELPYALRLTSADIGYREPYLRCSSAATRADGLFHVGLVWQAGGWDLSRSVPPGEFGVLTSIPNVRLYCLQPGECPPSLPALRRSGDCIDSLAVFMTGLDLIITVDTMAAHLAGGLGLPVWTLLRSGCDWRWGDAGSSTPWYPSMRLFRQTIAGDWIRPIAGIAAQLQRVAAGNVRPRTQERLGG
jgi:hypothetical protein